MTFDIRRDTNDIYIGTSLHSKSQYQKTKQKYKKENMDESDKALTHQLVKKSDSDYIKKRRNELNITQKELAVRCNLNVKTIQDYENGTAIISNKILSNIKRHLQ